jgi:NAD(P)-dependent dehydrogenase (short-subunit alcohol dehydrogenase family)
LTTIALVTGASGAIGAEVARQLDAAGITVVVSARSVDRAQATAQSIGGSVVQVLPVGLDVADAQSVQTAAAMLAEDPGRLDILINNAAAYVDWTEMASTADMDAAQAVMEVNLFGAWRMTNALLPLLRRSEHPRVVHISSGGGSHHDEQFGLRKRHGAAAAYGISKAALNALTSTQAAEFADTPIIVNAVCPGLTATYPGAEAMGARPVVDGAASVLWAATLPDDGPRGGLFRDGKPIGW